MYTLTVGLAAAQMNYRADERPRLPDGSGGVRLDPDLHRLHLFRSRSCARWPERPSGEAAPPALWLFCSREAAAARRWRRSGRIYLQRFFGECGAEYGSATDVSKVEGECGIITAMINKFNAQNSDVHVSSNGRLPGPAIRSSQRRWRPRTPDS
jgi:hypothetical protein